MKIASWNVNSLKVRMPHLQQWLEDARPDVVALQETKLEDHAFPTAQLHEWGYRSVCSGQKTYNGVAVLAREEISAMHCDIPDFADPQKRVLAVTVGDVRIVNVYVVNGQAVGTEKFDYKLRQLAALTEWLRGEIAAHPKLVLLGDFNIAPDDSDVHDPEAWFEQVLCSTPEREAFQRILALGLHDSFRLREKGGGHFSWWDYRQGAFRRNNGLRIDLVLVSEALRERVTAVGLDRLPRTWDRPSDHIPAWAELAP